MLLVISSSLLGQELQIGLLRSVKIRNVTFTSVDGSYTLIGDSTNLGTFQTANFQIHEQGIKYSNGTVDHVFTKVRLVADGEDCALKIESISPSSKARLYQDNMELTVEGGQRIRVVNVVDMDHYLAGVIESEGGGGQHLEYYKVQAMMSRTYALKNRDRHKKEGFELCDAVHCQAYHSMLRHTPSIEVAVKETSGKVMVDNTGDLVTTYFSANCGGQTCDPSHVWNTSVPYLETFIDTFCIHTRQATWTAKVGKYAWKNYLEKEFGVTEEKYGDLIYNFEQLQRKAFFIHPSLGVPLRDLRTKFSLKSTYFSSHLEGEEVILKGRGFGHGVGLCQEGAMNMAKLGFGFEQIAHYYFKMLQIIDYQQSRYFK